MPRSRSVGQCSRCGTHPPGYSTLGTPAARALRDLPPPQAGGRNMRRRGDVSFEFRIRTVCAYMKGAHTHLQAGKEREKKEEKSKKKRIPSSDAIVSTLSSTQPLRLGRPGVRGRDRRRGAPVRLVRSDGQLQLQLQLRSRPVVAPRLGRGRNSPT